MIDDFVEQKDSLGRNSVDAFYLVQSKCTECMMAELEYHKDFEAIKNDRDILNLIKAIKEIAEVDRHLEPRV